jgi:hypothetical protein
VIAGSICQRAESVLFPLLPEVNEKSFDGLSSPGDGPGTSSHMKERTHGVAHMQETSRLHIEAVQNVTLTR